MQIEREDQQPQPVPLPIKLTESTDLSTRELAYAAQRYGKAAQRDSQDFDAVYNYGLALQELALRSTTSRQEQLALLQQVLVSPCDSLISPFSPPDFRFSSLSTFYHPK